MFVLKKTARFDKKLQKLLKKNSDLKSRIGKTLKQLSDNPKHPGLRTHQIDDSEYGKIWSSWVHGDLRIFWKYEGEQIMILLLDIGDHDHIY
ncbi:MAG: type II toxin-antitoxin system mRNA interferase toxin, RelE/StbE family [bacterium]